MASSFLTAARRTIALPFLACFAPHSARRLAALRCLLGKKFSARPDDGGPDSGMPAVGTGAGPGPGWLNTLTGPVRCESVVAAADGRV